MSFQSEIRNQRVRGIEPPCAAWEAAVLPLNYTRAEILDFRFFIGDFNRNKIVSANRLAVAGVVNHSLPRNHVVGCVEVGCSAVIGRQSILSGRPSDRTEAKS